MPKGQPPSARKSSTAQRVARRIAGAIRGVVKPIANAARPAARRVADSARPAARAVASAAKPVGKAANAAGKTAVALASAQGSSIRASVAGESKVLKRAAAIGKPLQAAEPTSRTPNRMAMGDSGKPLKKGDAVMDVPRVAKKPTATSSAKGPSTKFGTAFAEARKAGKATFDFGGKKYTTKLKDEPAKKRTATAKAAPTPASKPTPARKVKRPAGTVITSGPFAGRRARFAGDNGRS